MEVLDDVHDINVRNIRLREKLKKNLNTDDRRFGFLKHDINDYFACVPLVDDTQMRQLLDQDKTTWRTYYEKAAWNAKVEADDVLKLIETQKQQLEQLVTMSKHRLL